jgi:hypothetical protein
MVGYFLCEQWYFTAMDNFLNNMCRLLGDSMSYGVIEVHMIQPKLFPVNKNNNNSSKNKNNITEQQQQQQQQQNVLTEILISDR